jgi:hypothetical protein
LQPFHLISWNCGVSLKDGANLDHGVGGVGLNHGVGDVNFDHNAPSKLEEDLPNDGSFKLIVLHLKFIEIWTQLCHPNIFWIVQSVK